MVPHVHVCMEIELDQHIVTFPLTLLWCMKIVKTVYEFFKIFKVSFNRL